VQLFRLREAIYENCKAAYSRQQEPIGSIGFCTLRTVARSASTKEPRSDKRAIILDPDGDIARLLKATGQRAQQTTGRIFKGDKPVISQSKRRPSSS
jgi:hypothetical protein